MGCDPVGSDRLSRLRLEELIGAVRDAQPRQNAPAFLDQAPVGFDQRLLAAFEIEHGDKLAFQSLAALGVRSALIEVGEVVAHPADDEITVRPLDAGDHQVDFERFVDLAGV